MNLEDRPLYFNSLSYLEEKKGNYKRAIEMKDSVIAWNDSIRRIKDKALILSAQTAFEVQQVTERMQADVENVKRRNMLLVFIAVGLVVVALFIVIIYRSHIVRSRQKVHIASMQLEQEAQDRQIAEDRVKILEMESRLEQERLQRDLEEHQRQLSASSVFIASRNNLLHDIIDDIDNTDGTDTPVTMTRLRNNLNRLVKTADTDYENLLTDFRKANPGFFRRLNELHPGLSQADMNFLAYIRINMSLKDIASILNINPDSAKRRKNRISKKLGLESSADLFSYVLSIE